MEVMAIGIASQEQCGLYLPRSTIGCSSNYPVLQRGAVGIVLVGCH